MRILLPTLHQRPPLQSVHLSLRDGTLPKTNMGASRSAYLVSRLLPNRLTQIRMPSQSKNVGSGTILFRSVQFSHLNHRRFQVRLTVVASGPLGIHIFIWKPVIYSPGPDSMFCHWF